MPWWEHSCKERYHDWHLLGGICLLPLTFNIHFQTLISAISIHQRSQHECECHMSYSCHLCISHPTLSLSSIMFYSPFKFFEEDHVFYLRITLFALSLCIRGLICIHIPRPLPPWLIAARIVQIVWAFQFIFNIVLFFCEGTAVLLAIFNWVMTWLIVWVTFLSNFGIYWHTGCKAIQVDLMKSNTVLPLAATWTSYAIQQVIYNPNST